jgi:cobalt-zinc-cadmium resistance protein CzcA
MIRRVVDFALNNRLFVLAAALLLVGGGVVAFHKLPIDAYPDVADNYVEIITQWPGISAEQIEQQVTIPLEIANERILGHLEQPLALVVRHRFNLARKLTDSP